MARVHGTAGHTLRRKLVFIFLVAGTAGMLSFLIFRNSAPYLAPLAPLAGLIVAVKVLQDREVQRDLHAYGRGYLGEARIGKMLENLPSPWRVFHDVDLGGENADHVVVGTAGVFAIEVKNYSGKVSASAGGLYTHGKRNDPVVRQAHRQAHALRELLGVAVTPLLVFAGGRLSGESVGKLKVLPAKSLVPHLLAQRERKLEYAEAREIFAKLEKITR